MNQRTGSTWGSHNNHSLCSLVIRYGSNIRLHVRSIHRILRIDVLHLIWTWKKRIKVLQLASCNCYQHSCADIAMIGMSVCPPVRLSVLSPSRIVPKWTKLASWFFLPRRARKLVFCRIRFIPKFEKDRRVRALSTTGIGTIWRFSSYSHCIPETVPDTAEVDLLYISRIRAFD